jgi:hypothetical protein
MRHLFVSLVLWMLRFGAAPQAELPSGHAGGSTFQRLLHLFVVSEKPAGTLSAFRDRRAGGSHLDESSHVSNRRMLGDGIHQNLTSGYTTSRFTAP